MLNEPKKTTRIQTKNTSLVIEAALQVFSTQGYKGTTVEQIASAAGMSKANVLYYFRRKNDIYLAVLEHTLSVWLDPLMSLDPEGEPLQQLWSYTQAKLAMSRQEPTASRLFANEILHGADMIKPFLENDLKTLVDHKCHVIQTWIDEGKLASVSPLHLLFFIWSATQHYADFATQIATLHTGTEEQLFNDAEHTLHTIIMNGLKPS